MNLKAKLNRNMIEHDCLISLNSNTYSSRSDVLVLVLIFCSWVNTSRATVFVLLASTLHQEVL